MSGVSDAYVLYENSEPGYLVGLAHVKRCATLNEVKRYIIGEYSNQAGLFLLNTLERGIK